MTPERLTDLGFVAGSFPLTNIAANLSVAPDLQLYYFPVKGLAESLAALGNIPPAPPDLFTFDDPYRALFRLNYDMRLCGLITMKEWSIATDAAIDQYRVPSLNERLALKEAAMMRLSKVMAHIDGIRKNYAKTLLTLLYSVFSIRI